MRLVLDRCTVRSWRPSDAQRLAAIANDRSVSIMLRDRFPHPYARTDADKFIAHALDERPERSFAVAVDDVPVGGIGYIAGDDIHRVQAEVGYWLGAAWRGRGLATEALRGLVAWLWSNTELQHLRAGVFADNPASLRVLERCGFTAAHLARKAAVKDGLLRDEWIYTLVRDDVVSQPERGEG